jgi:protein phosphatase
MLVGAASAQPRRGGKLGRVLSRQRHGDTGELDPVPDEPVDPEELRYAPRPPHRRAGLRRLLLVLALLALATALLAGGYLWSQQQYYVAADGPQVAIYRGVQLDLPGIELSSTYEVDNLKVSELSEFNQTKIEDGIVADDLEDARRIVQNLGEQAEKPSPDPTPSPSADPSEEPSREPSKSPTRRAGAVIGDETAVLR